jgi:hypothetical protein
MYRSKKLVIRLTDQEEDAVNRLAQVECLPASTLARRLLLLEASKRPMQQRKTTAPAGAQELRP